MGIQGLLPLLKSIHKPCHLRKFAGQTLGVDAFGWLHRGAVACAIDLALDKPTTKYVDFAMNRVRMLVHFGVTPYLVFDGDSLPSKGITNKARRKSRKESKEAGLNLLKSGKPAQAQFELQKAVDVTPEMVGLLIAELKSAGVKYIVAPYEADSQLAYLEKKGLIQGIISEDSDLLVFGARCLLTKLDQFGECVMIRRDDFTACREISLVGWTDGDFRKMAIMSGCDYLPNIGGMGLKTAYRLLRKYKTMERVIRNLQFEGKFKVPAEYEKDFEQAELSFIYPWVYCPVAKELVSLTPPEDDIDPHTLPYIGKYVESKIAEGVSSGLLHPRTKEPLIMPLIASKSRYSLPGPAAKRAAATQQPDLKRGKSIDSFFRPHRTPLAELDPNSFAASPHQQQTLERAIGTSWPATPSPTTTVSRRFHSSLPGAARRTVSESVLRTPSTMPASRRSRSSVLPPSSEPPSLRSSTTDSRAIKRQRLCSIDDSADVETPTEQSSKFFADVPKQSKRKSELWSDESLDEALLNLPEVGIPRIPLVKSRKSIDIFQDTALTPTASPANVLPEVDTSQSTTGPTTFSQPEQETTEITPASSVEQSDIVPNSAPRPKLRGLAARFSYFSQESVPTLRSTASQGKVDKNESNETVELKVVSSTKTKLTKTLLSTVVGTHVFGPSTTDKHAPPSSMIAVNGSEDWLVSESETEGSERLELEVTATTTALDFSQFAFVPQA